MATLVRWEPFRELATLQSQVSRLMDGMPGNGHPAQEWVPPLDVWETEDEVVYSFDLPGVPRDKIEIEQHEGALTVTATRERPGDVSEGGFWRFERRIGTSSRTVGLPQGAEDGAVKADYRDGVLEIRVAKPEVSKPRRITLDGEHREIDTQG